MPLSLKLFIKKRTLIAVLITILFAVITNKYWLIIKPVSVDFDVNSKGSWEIEVSFNKKDDNLFNKIKSKYVDVNLDKTKHINININRIKHAKRIKLKFTRITGKSAIEVKNIKLQKGKVKLDNLNTFILKGGGRINH